MFRTTTHKERLVRKHNNNNNNPFFQKQIKWKKEKENKETKTWHSTRMCFFKGLKKEQETIHHWKGPRGTRRDLGVKT